MVCDRYGDDVYLTQERWQHIVEPFYHPEMSGFERQLKEIARSGMRKQDSLNPQKYRYIKPFFCLDLTVIDMPDSLMLLPLMKRRMERSHKPRIVNRAGTGSCPSYL